MIVRNLREVDFQKFDRKIIDTKEASRYSKFRRLDSKEDEEFEGR